MGDRGAGGVATDAAFLAGFVEQRAGGLDTGCAGPDFSVSFVVSDDAGASSAFRVAFSDGRVSVERGPQGRESDHEVHCTVAELRAIVDGRDELLGPFWERHLPMDTFAWGPALAAFVHPDHPYLQLTPALQEIYLEPRFYGSITPFTQGYALYELVLEHGLEQTVEIGLAFGASALFFLAAHAEAGRGRHHCFDPFQESTYDGKGLDLIRRSGLDGWLDFRPVRSQRGLRQLRREGVELDLVYVDGDHSAWGVLADFLGVDPLLRPGGFLAFDDSHWASGQQVLALIAEQFDYEVLPDRSTDRFTVLRKRRHVGGSLPLRLRVGLAQVARRAKEAARRPFGRPARSAY